MIRCENASLRAKARNYAAAIAVVRIANVPLRRIEYGKITCNIRVFALARWTRDPPDRLVFTTSCNAINARRAKNEKIISQSSARESLRRCNKARGQINEEKWCFNEHKHGGWRVVDIFASRKCPLLSVQETALLLVIGFDQLIVQLYVRIFFNGAVNLHHIRPDLHLRLLYEQIIKIPYEKIIGAFGYSF